MSVQDGAADGLGALPPTLGGEASAAPSRRIADHSPVVTVVAASPGFRIVYANTAARRLARSELIGRTAAGVFAFVDAALLATETRAEARSVADAHEKTWWDVSYVALDATGSEGPAVLITAVDVTHHEVAKAEARAARDTLDALLAYIPEGISIAHGPEVLVDHISARGVALVGRSAEVLTGKSALQQTDEWEVYRPGSDVALPPGDRPLARATRTGEVTMNETLVVRRPDGGLVTVLCNSGPIRDAAGAVTGAVMAWRDVTELQRAQAAVRDSEKRLRAVLLQVPAAIFIVEGPDARTTFQSRLLEVVLGDLDPDPQRAGVGSGGWAVHPDGSPYAIEEYPSRRALWRGETVQAEPMTFQRADGQVIHLEMYAGPVHGESGEIIAAVAVAMDVTERRKAETAAVETAAKFETLAQAMPSMVWTALPDGRIDWFNARVSEYSGVPADEMKPDGWTPVHPDDLATSTRLWREAVASGKAYDAEYRIRRHDGQFRWHITRAIPVRGADGAITRWVGTSADIQDRKSSEQALADLNATLEQQVRDRTAELLAAEATLRQSQKMEAVGQLTGGLAHDFNNLLTGITGSLELMETRLEQGRLTDLGRYLRIARGAAQRAASLTHRLLAFSRRQTLDPKPIDMNQLVIGIDDLVRRTVGPAVTVTVIGAQELWTVLADPNQLENALLNLCLNARDAMPDGGGLIIETGNQTLTDLEAKTLELAALEYAFLSVSDTGSGMTADVIARAFDPFYTTKPIGEGTGLGLSMVYGFARQSGGQARIRSQPGHGTEVRLYLPRFVGEGRVDDLSPRAAEAGRGDGRTVLVVDDESSVRLLINEVMAELGYHVLEAEAGASGLKILESDRHVDLLITDVGLPGGMNGRQLADAALVSRPNLKVLFITGYAEQAVIGDGDLEPCMHILTKPFSLETLGGRVREIIAAS